MTLSAIQTDISNRLPNGYFSSIITMAELTALINDAQRWVCRSHNFHWMARECTQSTTDGQQRYDLPDGTHADGNGVTVWRYKQDRSVELIDHNSYRVPLTRGYKRDIENMLDYADTSDSGTPEMYAIDHEDLWLYPAPDHSDNSDEAWTINLEYYGYLPDLSDSNTSNFLTSHCPELLVYKALALAYQIGQDYDKAQYWEIKAEELRLQLQREDFAAVHGGIETGSQPTTPNAFGNYPSITQVQTTGGYVDE